MNGAVEEVIVQCPANNTTCGTIKANLALKKQQQAHKIVSCVSSPTHLAIDPQKELLCNCLQKKTDVLPADVWSCCNGCTPLLQEKVQTDHSHQIKGLSQAHYDNEHESD